MRGPFVPFRLADHFARLWQKRTDFPLFAALKAFGTPECEISLHKALTFSVHGYGGTVHGETE